MALMPPEHMELTKNPLYTRYSICVGVDLLLKQISLQRNPIAGGDPNLYTHIFA